MLSSLLNEIVDFTKAAAEKILVGALYGFGAIVGIHAAAIFLAYVL